MAATPQRPSSAIGIEILDWNGSDEARKSRLIDSRSAQIMDNEGLRRQIAELVDDVRRRGDTALIDALREFDGCEIDAGGLVVGEEEFERALATTPPETVAAIEAAIDQSRRFNELVVERRPSWRAETAPGVEVGEQIGPIASAGLFVPSGKGSFPSVLIHIATPAVTAGVPALEVAMAPLKGRGGELDPAALVVARTLGIDRVFRCNGPAGVAAMAFGTATVPAVGKVVGPGSPAVMCAELEVQRFGCATMLLLGPTESMIIADRTAAPELLAADLINEAEHGHDSASVLVADDRKLLEAVLGHLAGQLDGFPEERRAYVLSALCNGGLVLVDGIEQALELINAYAPEHLQVATADPESVAARVEYASEILLGQATPFSAANYSIGVPASLPTGGFAKAWSGINASAFQKSTSIARLTDEGLAALAATTRTLARHEGFPGHEAAISIRTGGGTGER